MRNGISDFEGKGAVDLAYQLVVFAELQKVDFENYDSEGEVVVDSIEDNCRVGMEAGTVGVVLDSEVFDEIVGKGIGPRSLRMMEFVCRVTGQSMIQPATASHAAEALGLGAVVVEEEDVPNMRPGMKMVMHNVHLDIEDQCSRLRDVCPVRRARDSCSLRSPAVEEQIGLA